MDAQSIILLNGQKTDASKGYYENPIYNWILANPILFPEPIPAKGKLSFGNTIKFRNPCQMATTMFACVVYVLMKSSGDEYGKIFRM